MSRQAILARLLTILALAAAAFHCFPLAVEKPLAPGTITPREGHSYSVSIDTLVPEGWGFGPTPDSNDKPLESPLRVLEDGKALAMPHAVHQDITDKGGGRYSHWGRGIVLSASDNSDPRSNGRSYAISYPMAPPSWSVYLLVLAAAAAWRPIARAGFERAARRRAALFWIGALAVAAILNGAFLAFLPAPRPFPDTVGYLEWSQFRTLGYPLLLHAYHSLAGTWAFLPIFQLNLLLCGLFVLAYSIARATDSYVTAWILLCLVVGFGNMLLSTGQILTEPVFAAFLMAHVAFLMRLLESGARRWGIAAGLALAAAILTKSVAVVLLGPLALMIAFGAADRRKLLAAVFLPALLAWFVPSAYNLARLGHFESSVVGGYALSGHVAWAIKPRAGDAYAAQAARIERRLQPVLSKRPQAFANIDEYINYTANEYNTLLWANLEPELKLLYPEACAIWKPCTWKAGDVGCDCERTLSRAMLGLSREAIRAEPRNYAYHVAAHFYGLWRDASSQGRDFFSGARELSDVLPAAYEATPQRFDRLLAPLPPLRSAADNATLIERVETSAGKRLLDLVLLRRAVELLADNAAKNPFLPLCLGLAASLLVFFASRLSVAGKAFCYAGLCLNAYFLGTALAQPSLVRYAWAMQGVLAAMIVLAPWVALDAIWKKRQPPVLSF